MKIEDVERMIDRRIARALHVAALIGLEDASRHFDRQHEDIEQPPSDVVGAVRFREAFRVAMDKLAEEDKALAMNVQRPSPTSWSDNVSWVTSDPINTTPSYTARKPWASRDDGSHP